jgi:DNA polymerase-3 subunit delta
MPAIATGELAGKLARGKTPSVILLLGQDSYLREISREQVIEAVVEPAARAWAVQTYSAAEEKLATVLGMARMMPMLAPRQVIVFTDLEAIEPAPESKSEDASEMLREYLSSPAPFTVLLLEAARLDQRMRLSKLLLEHALVVAAELPEDPDERLRVASRVTKQMALREKSAIEDDAAEELADLCNGDLAAVRAEIAKLATYAGPDRKISRADIEALVVAEKKYSVWELADVLAAGEPARALKFLDQLLREGEPPPQLVGAMAWMFRKLLEAQELGRGISPGQAAGRLGMRRDAAETALRQAQKILRRRLVSGLRALYDADSRLKSGAKDERSVMEFLVVRLAAGGEAGRRSA